MHLAWETSVGDFNTQTQPLLATNVGSHAGLLVVGGSKGNAYGYDALTGTQVWSRALSQASFNCHGGGPAYLGVGGTGVLDASTGSIYFTSNSNSTVSGTSQLFINRLSVVDGSLQSQVNFTPNLLAGELNFTHTALTLSNGMLYAGTSSSCDISSWRGSIAAVNESTLAVANPFYTVFNQAQAPNPSPSPFSGGGVWGWGGVSVDPSGNLWAGVGNLDTNSGATGPQAPFVPDSNEFDAFGDHVVQVTPDLTTALQSNYPGFTFGGAAVDLDLDGTPVLSQPFGCDVMAALQGKSGFLYVYDTTNIASGPIAGYQFTSGTYHAPNLGNPAFSPITGLYYAAVASGGSGGVTQAPGMVAVSACNSVSSIVWSQTFGPDSLVAKYPRSAPTVTAGGVVLVGTPCENDGNGGCTGTSGTYGGALWALDAISGALLNGGNPIITTPSAIRMGAVVDGDWVFLYDNQGDLYGFTIDSAFPAVSDRFRRVHRLQHTIDWR